MSETQDDADWLDSYTLAHKRQKQYVEKIVNLQKDIMEREHKNTMAAIKKLRHLDRTDTDYICRSPSSMFQLDTTPPVELDHIQGEGHALLDHRRRAMLEKRYNLKKVMDEGDAFYQAARRDHAIRINQFEGAQNSEFSGPKWWSKNVAHRSLENRKHGRLCHRIGLAYHATNIPAKESVTDLSKNAASSSSGYRPHRLQQLSPNQSKRLRKFYAKPKSNFLEFDTTIDSEFSADNTPDVSRSLSTAVSSVEFRPRLPSISGTKCPLKAMQHSTKKYILGLNKHLGLGLSSQCESGVCSPATKISYDHDVHFQDLQSELKRIEENAESRGQHIRNKLARTDVTDYRHAASIKKHHKKYGLKSKILPRTTQNIKPHIKPTHFIDGCITGMRSTRYVNFKTDNLGDISSDITPCDSKFPFESRFDDSLTDNSPSISDYTGHQCSLNKPECMASMGAKETNSGILKSSDVCHIDTDSESEIPKKRVCFTIPT